MTDDTIPGQDEAAASEKPQAQFGLQRIYLKDISFESPQGFKALQLRTQPQVNQDISSKVNKIGDDTYEVVLSLTVTVKNEDETLYLVEVHQAGLFTVRGFDNKQLAQVVNTQCPNILFPYARETLDNMVVRGGFPPLLLPPINFDALFQQALAQARLKAEEKAGTGASEQAH